MTDLLEEKFNQKFAKLKIRQNTGVNTPAKKVFDAEAFIKVAKKIQAAEEEMYEQAILRESQSGR